LILAILGLMSAPASAQLFLVDDTSRPKATIRWETKDGEKMSLASEVSYTDTNDRTSLGHNVELFVAVGGTRLEKGWGHPDGAIIRVGYYKADNFKPFFEDIKDGADVHVKLENVAFNQPARGRPRTILQHIKYTIEDVLSCGLTEDALDQYNTASPTETLGTVITTDNGRLGVLDGSRKRGGEASLVQEDDGTFTLTARIPYALFRHVRDPWLRTTPGTFFEPYHFHVEFEVVPERVPLGERDGSIREEMRDPEGAAKPVADEDDVGGSAGG
jgi:hypothetical protein